MLVVHAIALFVDQNRDEIRAVYAENFKDWKKDCISVQYARDNARADTVRWIEDRIGLNEDQRAAYDQLQDDFTMRVFMGGVEKIAKKLAPFYDDEEYTGSGLELQDDLIIDEQMDEIGANNTGRLHPVQMADRNERAGYFFFRHDTMKFFQSIIETSCTDRGVFITSERFDDQPRHYVVRVLLENGDVRTVTEKVGTLARARELMLIVDALIAQK